MSISLILIVLALVLFVLATIPVGARFNLVAAGLACLTLAWLLSSGGLRA